ncbi:hypothetical protein BDF19DRAFT_427493, partial [Syncephalis fuscata]
MVGHIAVDCTSGSWQQRNTAPANNTVTAEHEKQQEEQQTPEATDVNEDEENEMVEEEEREEGEVAVAVVVVEEEQEQQEEQELPPPAKKGRQRKTRPVAGINLASGGVKTRRQTEELEKTAKQLAIVAAAAKKPEEGAVETMVCDMEEGMALEDEPAMGEREEGEVEVEDGED